MPYVSDLIGDDYKRWNSDNPRMRNILISAGTGTGKTTFILTKLLLYCAQENKKILFLSNRKALEIQVKEQVARLTAEPGLEAAVAERIPESITVGIYQSYLPWLRNLRYIFTAYSPVIADGFMHTYSDNNTFYADLSKYRRKYKTSILKRTGRHTILASFL
ncbi:MAG: DEAD/DEAH box helicase family protein [Ruminiclostridium sp.]